MKKLLLLLIFPAFIYACQADSVAAGATASTGKGGSTARFTIAKNYLYIVDNQSLKVFNILDAANPTFIKKVSLNTVVETIFPFNNHLLIGTQNGMYVFSISTPENPQFVSIYSHIVSCDPVVAEGNFAYVTLRNGTNCNRGINSLDVIDIKSLNTPTLLKSYPMKSPHGLGVDGNLLFVTEGDYGLKVFDKTNPLDLKEIKNFQDFAAVDVIADANTLIITGKDGIYQYSYNAQNELKLLSKIAIEP
jgi:hypothetical protein